MSLFKHLISVSLVLLLVLPFGIPGALIAAAEQVSIQILFVALFPILAISLYLGISIGFARLGIDGVKPGRFPRELDHPIYGRRRLYGVMWTALYYFKPLYWLLLSTRFTKTILLRGFGYKGSIDIVVYPDTWIRDLPLLELDKGVYLANKATLGTNMCLADGTILVDRIKIGRGSVVGHLSMIAPGVEMGEGCETGSGSAIGIGVKMGDRVSCGPHALINHGARIAHGVVIGTSAHVGAKVQINVENLRIPSCAFIPDHAVINSAQDLLPYLEHQAPRVKEVWSTPQSS
jgi:carbonic anhydrase/acetyltransferase-like protein (isoleucine patch superfamily)